MAEEERVITIGQARTVPERRRMYHLKDDCVGLLHYILNYILDLCGVARKCAASFAVRGRSTVVSCL